MDEIGQQTELENREMRMGELHTATLSALEQGDTFKARRLFEEASSLDPVLVQTDQWIRTTNIASWPDHWLIAAVRRDPPDTAALDVLVDRYWKSLFARCELLTLSQQKASDLAQEAWRRVLRARANLRGDGNFFAYLSTTATNLWRDQMRSAQRAGVLADSRVISLDAPQQNDEGETLSLSEVVGDLGTLAEHEQLRLKLDIDQALAQLDPWLREVLVARFIEGQSAAEIGRRYGRTEQTVSGWIRRALRVMRAHLEEPDA